MLKALRDAGSSVLVMGRSNPRFRSTSLREYLAHLDCPLFLVC